MPQLEMVSPGNKNMRRILCLDRADLEESFQGKVHIVVFAWYRLTLPALNLWYRHGPDGIPGIVNSVEPSKLVVGGGHKFFTNTGPNGTLHLKGKITKSSTTVLGKIGHSTTALYVSTGLQELPLDA